MPELAVLPAKGPGAFTCTMLLNGDIFVLCRSSRGMATTRAVAVAAEATDDQLGLPIERYRALVLDSSYRPINVGHCQCHSCCCSCDHHQTGLLASQMLLRLCFFPCNAVVVI